MFHSMKTRQILKAFFWSLFFCAMAFADPADDHVSSGRKKFQAGDYDGAIAEFDRAIGLSPKNVLAFNSRGAAKRRKGDLAAAIIDYDQALTIDPKSVL